MKPERGIRNMDTYTLSNMEIDAVGEILNISLGASATAVSTMLDTRVDITTPVVKVKHKDEFEFASIEPAVRLVTWKGLTVIISCCLSVLM